MSGELPFAYIRFDREELSDDPHGRGRRLRVDARCLGGDTV